MMGHSVIIVIFAIFGLLQTGFCGKRQVNDPECTSFLSWRCDNGECIDFTQRCNGHADCTDGSDETVRECISFQCSENKFRCIYGACVNRSAECDQHKDCIDNSDELTAKCLPDLTDMRRGNCTVEEYQCKSGECIAIEDLCDGKSDCSDTSDETIQQCASKCCPPFGFQCGYGACIDDRAKCDGVTDCIDGSDENAYLCGYHNPSHKNKRPDSQTIRPHDGTPTGTTESQRQRPGLVPTQAPHSTAGAPVRCFSYPDFLTTPCEIVAVPANGWIEYLAPARPRALAGRQVDSFTPILYRCHENFVLNGRPENICFNGHWMYAVPNCLNVTLDERVGKPSTH